DLDERAFEGGRFLAVHFAGSEALPILPDEFDLRNVDPEPLRPSRQRLDRRDDLREPVLDVGHVILSLLIAHRAAYRHHPGIACLCQSSGLPTRLLGWE